MKRFRMYDLSRLFLLMACLLVSGAARGGDETKQVKETDPLRWQKQMDKFAEYDAKATDRPEHPIVFVGSSSIAMWGTLNEDMQGLNVLKRGFGGSHSHEVNHWIRETVLKYAPSRIVYYCGENDIAGGHPAEHAVDGFKTFVSKVHAEFPECVIYYLPMKPSPKRWNLWEKFQQGNQELKAFADATAKVIYVDTATVMLGENGEPKPEIWLKDKLHMNHEGYKVWTAVLKPLLEAEPTE